MNIPETGTRCTGDITEKNKSQQRGCHCDDHQCLPQTTVTPTFTDEHSEDHAISPFIYSLSQFYLSILRSSYIKFTELQVLCCNSSRPFPHRPIEFRVLSILFLNHEHLARKSLLHNCLQTLADRFLQIVVLGNILHCGTAEGLAFVVNFPLTSPVLYVSTKLIYQLDGRAVACQGL